MGESVRLRPYFIVNPVAGGGKAKEKFEAVRRYLDGRGAEYSFIETEKAGETARLALEAYERGERFIVPAGGDGTLSETVSALYDKGDVLMGLCPFGTGNDFARALKLPDDPAEAARILIEGEPKPIDAGLAGDKPFINIMGLGFDVDVVNNTDRYKKRFGGGAYLMGVIRSMTHLKGIPLRLTANGSTFEENALIMTVANGTHFGGGMNPAPGADPSDGLFDVCIVRKVGFFTFLRLLPKFIKGTHIGVKQVSFFRTAELKIECESTPLELDGELGEFAPLTVMIRKGALRFMLDT